MYLALAGADDESCARYMQWQRSTAEGRDRSDTANIRRGEEACGRLAATFHQTFVRPP
jgi:hypothetical protein